MFLYFWTGRSIVPTLDMFWRGPSLMFDIETDFHCWACKIVLPTRFLFGSFIRGNMFCFIFGMRALCLVWRVACS